MEQLSLLQKIYLYGETLSSEELNQIVLYLNSSIEAINALIAKNNNINEGHCEMRYKVSAQLPEAPESGTDGKSNGWSDTYTKPNTANGEITWMTLSFLNGEGVYGAWSTPVCITWGSVQGQKGPKGESGLRGSFKSRVFKRLNTIPDTPTGGDYDNPYPTSGGWTDGIPTGKEIIWSSVCTFYGNGLSSGWTVPAAESDNDTLDIEFSPSAVQPLPPTGGTPFTNHESEGWYDPSSSQFNLVGTMVWRAERKVSNGTYNGDWTITRIVGEKGERGESGLTGGHYEFRYNNFKPSEQASAPTKPEPGSNGTTNGWTTSQETLTETLIKDGYATWMTQCYQNEAGIYNTWTDPIRITGANGYDGADGIDIEFVYTRREDVWANPTPPPTTQTDDWPTNGNSHSATVNGVTWYDNPLGVTDVLMYEYVSLRLKVDDVWSAYSTPVVWSKWGEKGMDGDGFEYIYKRFQTIQNWDNITGDNNPANWKTNHSEEFLNTREYLGPTDETKWDDDPQGIDERYKYEYVSVRLEIDNVWSDYSTPTLWSGMPGVFLSRVFTRTNDDISNVTPSGGTYAEPKPDNTVVGSGQNQKTYIWEDSIPNGEAIIWSSTCTFNGDGTSNGWSKPLKESDTANLDIEFTDVNSDNGSEAPAAPSGNTPFSDHSSETPAWYDPSNIPANTTMVWRAERKVANGVYVGNWVISRIKGEKGNPGPTGGNYEFRFKNYTPTTAKPIPDAPTLSGDTDNWTVKLISLTEQELKDGKITWMSNCYKTYSGTYSTWSTPIRISGANGANGEDGSDVEFIYTRNNSGLTPDAPPTTQQDDWYGTLNEGEDNEITWTDNPVGVEPGMRYEYIAVREKPAGKNQNWGPYTVALWSKWGDTGMDGDGIEYIFKAFEKKQTWGASDTITSETVLGGNYNPANWAASTSAEYYGPEGYEWSDDPVNIDSTTNKYEYVSVRRFKLWPNETKKRWGTYETPKLWARYADKGDTGGHYEFRYCNYTPSTNHETPTKPSDTSDGIGTYGTGVDASTWARSVLDPDVDNGEFTYMSQCYVTPGTPNNNYSVWTDPVRITGALGERGADGSDIEFIYTRKSTIWDNPTAPTISDDATIAQDDWPNINGSTPSKTVNGITWYDSPLGVDGSGNKYEYMCVRYKYAGTSSWTAYNPPVIWSSFGETGMDGDGYEYIFKHFQYQQTWANSSTNTDAANNIQGGNDNPNNWSTSLSGFQNREFYGPLGHTWSDDPQGISPNHLYEYVSTREYKLWPGETQKRWGTFSTPTLWSNFAKASDGGNYEFRYTNTSNSNPTKPTTGYDGIGSYGSGTSAVTWSRTPTTLSSSEIKQGIFTYMTYGFKSGTGSYGEWSTPIRITGANGEDGADGSDIEFLYARTKTSAPPTKPSKPSGNDNGSYTYGGVTRTWKDEDWGVGKTTGVAATNGDTTWSDNPRGVSNDIKYEWIIVRTKPSGKNKSFDAFSNPVIWSKYGEKGMDGDGYEYIFKLSTTKITSWSTNANDYSNPANWPVTDVREYWGPYPGNWPQNNNNPLADYRWSDDPLEVDSINKYLYMSTRQRVNGHWLAFNTPVLWNNYAEAGATVQGPQGKLGPMSYLAGIWKNNITYTKTETKNPVVYYTPNDSYYYLKDLGSSTGDNPVGTGMTYTELHPNPWLQAENYNMVFTDILFVNNFAKLGSFIVNQDWILCHYGTIYDYGSGVHPILNTTDSVSTDASHTYNYLNAYLLFDSAYPDRKKPNNWNFVPNYAVNAVTGEIFCNNAHISGEVTATSGTFNGTVNATSGTFTGVVNASSGVFNGIVNATSLVAGDTTAMNIKTSSNRIEFCQGTNTIAYFEADGSGIQLHIWDSSGKEYTIDFTKWNAVNQGTFNNETWYLLGSSGPTSITLSLNSSDNKYYYNANTSSGLVNGNYYTKSNAKVFELLPLNSAARPEIFAPYVKSGTTYAIALNNVSKYTKYTFTNGVRTATTNYLYYTTSYPNTITFNGYNVDSITQYKSTYLNPRTTQNIDYRWTLEKGTETYSQTVICAEAITGATHYSTSPEVYAVTLPTPTPY